MSRTIEHGSTNQRVRLRILDSDGLPATGIAYNASGIGVSYQRIGATASTVTLAAGTGLASEHDDGRWNEIGNGWYQLDAPDAAFASGVDSVLFYGTATGYTFIFEQITLVTSQVYPTNFDSMVISVGGVVSADMVAISGDSTAADNLESYCDGTTPQPVNATQFSGSSTAADNAETCFTGTITTLDALDTAQDTQHGTTQTAIGNLNDITADQVRTEMDSNSTQLAAIVEDTGTTLPATLTSMTSAITTIDGIVDAILLDTAEIGAAGAGLTEAGGTGDQLTAITGIILDAAGIRSAIGMAAADLDTQLGVITADTNELQTDWANGGRLDTLLDTAASGGGGDATEAKQDQIIGLISSGTITSNSPVDPNTNTVTIIRNATYDGTARPTLAFTVSKDYTGWTGTFTVNHRDTGVELISASVTVTSSTLLNVALAAADTALTALLDDEEFGRHPYDIQMTSGSSNDVLGPYIAQLVKDVKG